MEIEKVVTLRASMDEVWKLLLDPQMMASCVPGVESIEIHGERDFSASMKVSMSFVTARFKVKGSIVEMQPPRYLRSSAVGEDSTVTSSLKQASEVFLEPKPDGSVELRTKLSVEVFGRLGTFGLNMVRTKADRMWDEFARNLAARLDAGVVAAADASNR